MTETLHHSVDDDIRFCLDMKEMISLGKTNEAIYLICEFMAKYPNSPVPHNLIGIIYEKAGNHILALKHFRAAWCLDPTYLPARENMSNFSSFEPVHKFFYEESECSKSNKKYEIQYDSNHIGHVVEKISYI